ncbi:hypothetical protein AAMO2058_000703500 [Amorphochlora amoebiformis]
MTEMTTAHALDDFKKAAGGLDDGPDVAGPLRRNGRFITESCLQRYLTANDGDVKKAVEQLKKTIEWRKEYKPWRRCPKCEKNRLSHNLRVIGFDKDGRAIIYTSFSQAHERFDAHGNLKHLSWVLEQAVPLMDERKASKWSWISDFDGFGTADCSPKSMFLVKNMLAHYPERLHKAVLLEAPWLFNGLWRVVSPVLDKRTREKVVFAQLSSLNTSLAESLQLSTSLENFLLAEAKDNRIARETPKRFWELRGSREESKEEETKKEVRENLADEKAIIVDFRACREVVEDEICRQILFQFGVEYK